MKTFEYDLLRWVRFFKGHFLVLVGIVFLSVMVMFGIARFIMPVKYKSFSIITIPTRYFQYPAVEDIIPSVSDAAEMKTLRESLLNSTLTRKFHEELRQKYGLFPAEEADSLEYEKNMQKFADQFEVLSLGVTTFQVGYVGRTAEESFEVARDVQTTILDRLIDKRNKRLIEIRDNLLGRVDSMGFSVNDSADILSNSRPEVLRGELSQLRDVLKTMSSRYTEQHPMVKKYRARESLIVRWLKDHGQSEKGATAQRKGTLVEGLASASMADLDRYADLLKRVDRLNVVIEFEASNSESLVDVTQAVQKPLSPVWPNYRLVAIWGLLLGAFLALIYAAFRGVSEVMRSPAAIWANESQILYMGKVPDLREEIRKTFAGPASRDQTMRREKE